MSATAATSAYWRAAGMTYLKYANLCAEVLRGSLKEPFLGKVRPARAGVCLAGPHGALAGRAGGARGARGRGPTDQDPGFVLSSPSAGAALTAGSPRAQAKAREIVYFKATPFADGKAGKPGAWQRSACALGLRRATQSLCSATLPAAPARHGADCAPGHAVITEVVSQIK